MRIVRPGATLLFAVSFFACGETVDPMTKPPLSIVTTELLSGVVGEVYSARLEARDGSGSGYVWSSSGTLPTGLAISADGTISGTPTSRGAFRFKVEVTDSEGATAANNFTIEIEQGAAALQIRTQILPRAIVGETYEERLFASDGSGRGYSWSLIDGALPPGLSLNGEGTISGTPETEGFYDFTVQVRDDAGNIDDQGLTIEVDPQQFPPLVIDTDQLADGIATFPYMEMITASGGSGSGYMWSISGGALPSGLTLEAEGTPATTLSGVAVLEGLFDVEIQVTDSAGSSVRAWFSLLIARQPPLLDVILRPLADGMVTMAYTATIAATGGTGAGYGWTIAAGALPPGLTLRADGTPSTVISGVPTATGRYNFSVRVTDSLGHEDVGAFSIEINPLINPITIDTLTVPGGTLGAAYEATLSTVPGTGSGVGYNWLVTAGSLPPGLLLELSGTPSTRIVGIPTAGGLFSATITVFDSNNTTDSQDYVFDIFMPLNISTASVPSGQQNTAYSTTLSAVGGSASNYTWSIVQGALPTGLTLASSGTPSTTLSGTPAESGTFNFTVEVRDDSTGVATRDFSLSLVAGLTVELATLPDARIGYSYSAPISAVGGTGSGYMWTVSAGSLTPGLSLAPTGTPVTTLSGMPTVHGDYTFTVTVTDSAGTMASGDFSLHVLGGDRWVAWVGDTRVDGSNDVVVAGLPALAATAPVVINPIIAGGSASTSVF